MIELMLLGIGLGCFTLYVILPFIGWIFNIDGGSDIPRIKIRPIDYTAQLESRRKWMKSLNERRNK